MAVSKSKAVGQIKAKLYENHVKRFLISHILSFMAHAPEMVCEPQRAAAGLAPTSMTRICHRRGPTGRSQGQGHHPAGALDVGCATGANPRASRGWGDGPALRICHYLRPLSAHQKGTR